MRRYLAGALLILMVTQSSGTAIAGTPGPSNSQNLAALFTHFVGGYVSALYAIAMGTADRYDAVHRQRR